MPSFQALAPDFAWYRLDETSGTTAHDSSPNHYDVMNLDGVVWNEGANFDGATVCGSTVVGQALRRAPVTMTAWLTALSRSDETDNSWALLPFPSNALSGDEPALGGFGLGLNVWTDGPGGSGMGAQTGVNKTVGFHTAGEFQANVESFSAVVIAPAQAILYVNGISMATVAVNTPLAKVPAPLHLGCHNDDSVYKSKRFFKGRMRDARIYTRLLDANEIAQLFADGPW
jgi:large repetitive protein